MSYKPCRGNRVLLDKAIQDSHEFYFKFFAANSFIEKCKTAFKWMRAEKYLSQKSPLYMLNAEFLKECETNPKTYKPLLKFISENKT